MRLDRNSLLTDDLKQQITSIALYYGIVVDGYTAMTVVVEEDPQASEDVDNTVTDTQSTFDSGQPISGTPDAGPGNFENDSPRTVISTNTATNMQTTTRTESPINYFAILFGLIFIGVFTQKTSRREKNQ